MESGCYAVEISARRLYVCFIAPYFRSPTFVPSTFVTLMDVNVGNKLIRAVRICLRRQNNVAPSQQVQKGIPHDGR